MPPDTESARKNTDHGPRKKKEKKKAEEEKGKEEGIRRPGMCVCVCVHSFASIYHFFLLSSQPDGVDNSRFQRMTQKIHRGNSMYLQLSLRKADYRLSREHILPLRSGEQKEWLIKI